MRKTQRSFLDSCKGGVKFREEFRPEAKALPYSFNDLVPRSGFFRGSAMCRKTLFQERLLPLLERYLIDIRRDVIP